MVGCDLTLSLIEQPKPALLLFYSNARQFYLLKKRTSGSLFLHPFPSRPAKTVTFIILLCLTPPGGKGLRLFSTHCKTPLAPSLREHASLWDNSKTWLKLHLNSMGTTHWNNGIIAVDCTRGSVLFMFVYFPTSGVDLGIFIP